MPGVASSIPAALRQQADRQPDSPAFTFIDYEVDPGGFSETLTWAQLRGRVAMVIVEHHAESVLPLVDRAYVLTRSSFAPLEGLALDEVHAAYVSCREAGSGSGRAFGLSGFAAA